jgi:hypothetical protein
VGVVGMIYTWASGGGDDGYTTSLEVSFAPAPAVAQVSLSEVGYNGAEGDVICGITQFQTRHGDPSGPDDPPVNLGAWTRRADNSDWFGLPPSVSDDRMTRVTAELWMNFGQFGTCTLNVWIWE